MSLQTQHDPKNEAEIAYWNSTGGRHWVERQQSQDIVLGPILQATLERAQLRQGERVVDIGCGTGASSIALAGCVGPSGQVLGVDVSAPMLERAAERLPPGAPVKFVRADATTYRFEAAAFDLLFSRFGVMFFAEPARAFANLRTALKPSGRLAFACWRKFDENPWLQVPLRAALEHVPPLPRPGPEDPGPSPLPANSVCTAFLRTPGFTQLYLSRATSISTLPAEAGSKRPSRPRWHSDPQAAPCRTKARKRVPRLPRRSAARCSPINAVSRLRLPEQSGSSPRTKSSVWRCGVP
jgi:SAM-dependent methyltransferase